MQIALLLVFGFFISAADFSRHIIPNRDLLVFAGSICVFLMMKQNLLLHITFAAKVLLILVVFQWLTTGVMGMGDAKYLFLLSLLVGTAPVYLRGLFFSVLWAFVISLAYFLVRRRLDIDIPLAPAFTLGFTCALIL